MKRLTIVLTLLLVLPYMALAQLPDTGQTKCYNNTVEMIPCPSSGEDFYGQDAQYVTNTQSYTILGGGTMVQDNNTGLIWEVKTDDGSIHDKDDKYYWAGAQTFITALNSSQFGGYFDWRLPSAKELMLIVNRDAYPMINISYFPNTIADWYWALPITPHVSYYAWVVYFNNGIVTWGHTSSDYGYVRAVRGEKTSNCFIDNGDFTVTDTSSGLMWQKNTAPSTYNWQDALSYCENLSLGGHDDWRLPDVNELQSLVDYSIHSPSIDTTFFPDTEVNYWSSTTRNTNAAFALLFNYGNVTSLIKLDPCYVRAVRFGLSVDSDCDSIFNGEDNCPYEYNPNQENTDGDMLGDVCDDCPYDPENDMDDDGLCGDVDNCPETPNGPDGGTCVDCNDGSIGLSCTDNEQCSGGYCSMDQEDYDGDTIGDVCDADIGEDNYPPDGNDCIDACECEADVHPIGTPDGDVDGSDAFLFKANFGRENCTETLPCFRDFECDKDVDGSDAFQFKVDFGRTDCPVCVFECVYP